jgi:hypothetical protein
MVDCELQSRGGSWGCVCVDCAVVVGVKTPCWGKAQLYARVHDGSDYQWVLVAGYLGATNGE